MEIKKLSYLLELGGKKQLYEMKALELETFDDVQDWIIESLYSDCEYYGIVMEYNKKDIFVNEDENKKVFLLNLRIKDIFCNTEKYIDILESNLDVVSRIIYKWL